MDNAELLRYAGIIEQGRSCAGWLEARNSFALQFQFLVEIEIVYMYSSMVRQHPLFEDLVQAGMLGLLDASGRVTVEKYESFPPYARLFIRKQIVKVWHDNQLPVSLPRNKGELAGKMSKRARNEHDDGYVSFEDTVSLFPDESLESVRSVYDLLTGHRFSLDGRLGADDGSADVYKDRVAHSFERLHSGSSEEAAFSGLRSDALSRMLDSLGVLEGQVIKFRFGFVTGKPEPYSVCARTLGVGVGAVKEAEHSGFAKLCHESRRGKLFL